MRRYWIHTTYRPLKEATMIVIAIAAATLTVIGAVQTARLIKADGFGRIPTRQV